MEERIRFLDIEVYTLTNSVGAQARYLVHGHDDVLWTDNLDQALEFLRESCSTRHD
tara:strand:- start:48 stop:215 length:168 start_codon:yes stop_codon:yes gene_type:complete